MVNPVLSSRAENQLLEMESEDQARVCRALTELRPAGAGAISGVGYLVTLVSPATDVTDAGIVAEMEGDVRVATLYKITYRPLTGEQVPLYPDDAVFWVVSIDPLDATSLGRAFPTEAG